MSNPLTTSKGPITIRPAAPADAASLRELRLEALANYPAAFAADYAITAAQSIEFWAERIIDNTVDDKGVICVATAESQFIGMSGLLRGHWPKIRHSGVIWGVYVKPEWRGLHVAEALLDECITWAKAHSVVMVKLAGKVAQAVANSFGVAYPEQDDRNVSDYIRRIQVLPRNAKSLQEWRL